MKPLWIVGLTIATLVLAASPAGAQPVIGAKSGLIAYVEGKVYLGDQPLELGPAQFPDVKEKSVVRTEEGRAEILLNPGVFLRLGENSSLRMITNRLIDTRVELVTGSAVVEADDIAKDNNVTIVCKDGTASLTKGGIYRFDAEPARIKVFKGLASVQIAGQTILVSEGKMLALGGQTASVEKFDREDTDALDRWSRRRAEYTSMANVSAAKQVHDTAGLMSDCYGNSTVIQNLQPAGTWRYNPWYGMATYIPCNGSLMSPYGYRYWSPGAVYRAIYVPRPVPSMGGFGGRGIPYPTTGATSTGYSGTISAAPASTSAPATAGSTAASSAGSSSIGHGASSSSGRGR